MKITYKKRLQSIANHFGYKISKTSRTGLPEIDTTDPEFVRLLETYRTYTMTSPERMYALYEAVKYVLSANIPGDIVECGVWRGGSSMIIADLLKHANSNRKIYLYDTFEGMSEPTEHDIETSNTQPAKMKWKITQKDNHSDWCYASFDEVRKNMEMTGYNMKNIVFVKGKVEDTIPKTLPTSVALLRLDTDWYESTLHELIHLYPHLSSRGVLILDDYGHWAGAREATDTYFKNNNIAMLLSRIDYTGRMGIKN